MLGRDSARVRQFCGGSVTPVCPSGGRIVAGRVPHAGSGGSKSLAGGGEAPLPPGTARECGTDARYRSLNAVASERLQTVGAIDASAPGRRPRQARTGRLLRQEHVQIDPRFQPTQGGGSSCGGSARPVFLEGPRLLRLPAGGSKPRSDQSRCWAASRLATSRRVSRFRRCSAATFRACEVHQPLRFGFVWPVLASLS